MSSIKCGHCKSTHGSVAEVKACSPEAQRYFAGVAAARATLNADASQAEVEMHRMEAEGDLAQSLRDSEAKWAAKEAFETPAPVRSTYRPGTSAPISTLERAVPAGRYAVEEGGRLKFFQVDKPTEGRWAGYTFVKVQASDDTYGVKDRARRVVILTAIAQDPAAASARYGKELGACGVCGRTLTDEDSRARGIGPVCASKMGW